MIGGKAWSFTDALFESAAGFTTTAATAINDLEALPRGFLFWRSLTQWMGGLGIILVALSVLPVVKAVNVQLGGSEFSGQSQDKIQPRIIDAAKRLASIYIVLTLAEIVLLLSGGLGLFDSVCHSMSTVSSGGFSTRNDGISAFATPYIKIVLTVFMFLSGTSITLMYFVIKRNFRKLSENNEFVFYSSLTFIFIFLVSLLLIIQNGFGFGRALCEGSFEVVSMITTTGFYSNDYNLWSPSVMILLFILMFSGAMSGSTSGGIKIIRLLLITKNNRKEMRRLIHPSAYIPVRLDNHVVPGSVIHYLLIFIVLYAITVCTGALVLSVMDYDLITSFSTSASMLANIGPGFGPFGPFEKYSTMADQGKLFLSFLMVLGRLELASVLLLLTRGFYRQ
jgi:trk system potassium uptake protein TrkH